ncbi:hypothetical protein JL100_021650 [Skermanella mucosa]|uniref:hypothetical protein n=1 Tax=Skermanella mucosa TaxID=1789672 RepID=UPI00192CA6A8|nr:hypothetical protein [Skermanella mucosa]UEM19676.1 hypothetical protein JL100_021650 [Skermanella mucosa]
MKIARIDVSHNGKSITAEECLGVGPGTAHKRGTVGVVLMEVTVPWPVGVIEFTGGKMLPSARL